MGQTLYLHSSGLAEHAAGPDVTLLRRLASAFYGGDRNCIDVPQFLLECK